MAGWALSVPWFIMVILTLCLLELSADNLCKMFGPRDSWKKCSNKMIWKQQQQHTTKKKHHAKFASMQRVIPYHARCK